MNEKEKTYTFVSGSYGAVDEEKNGSISIQIKELTVDVRPLLRKLNLTANYDEKKGYIYTEFTFSETELYQTALAVKQDRLTEEKKWAGTISGVMLVDDEGN